MSIDYSKELDKAVREARKLGLDPAPMDTKVYSLDTLGKALALCDSVIYPILMQKHNGQYWGEQCLNLAAQSYMIFQHAGIDCDIVYGDVLISGQTYEYDTTLRSLKKELKLGAGTSNFNIHAWITFGKQYIVDFSISSRLNRHYDPNCHPYGLYAATPDELVEQKLEYIPMLVGSQFLEKTCGISFNIESASEKA